PLMVFGRAQPDIHLRIGIEICIHKTQQNRFIIEGLGHAFDEGREVKSDHVHANADLLQVILNEGSHTFAILVAGVGDDRKHYRVSVVVFQRAVLQTESLGLQSLQGTFGAVDFRLELAVEPELVCRRNGTNGGLSMSMKYDAAQISAVDGFGDGSPETRRPEPGFLESRN